MKADLTRATFHKARHYRSVRMQQGRVQLDAEWNEQQDITLHRVETETLDVIGFVGAPADDSGFVLTPTADKKSLLISQGRLYVNGILCENDKAGVTLDTQPDLPASACVIVDGATGGLPAKDGVYFGVVHVWPYHLTALEVPPIRETALGGPDTTTRLKTVWQVQALRVGDVGAAINCLSAAPAWDALTKATSGTMAARAEPTPDPVSPCKLAPTAGYRRLDNLLYRAEIHLIPGKDPAFKWSHDNGSIEAAWTAAVPGSVVNTLDLTVSSLGRDSTLSIAAGQYVELFDRNSELLFTPGTLVKVLKAEGTTVTVDTTTATGSTNFADFGQGARVRRWDGFVPSIPAATAASAEAGWIALEDGVEVQFQPAGGTFRHGDYWMFAARTATAISPATIEWPVDAAENPIFERPQGPPHAYARLAVLSCTGGIWSVLYNCAPSFPPLTELKNLYYVGGDAQCVLQSESMTLPKPLEVSVANGSLPVAGAIVRFTVTGGAGTLDGGGTTFDATTSAAGIASCTWTLDPNAPHQYAQAVIVEGGVPVTDKYQPVHFSANVLEQDSCACTVCVSTQAQAADDTAIQQAIDKVIANGGGTICLEAGTYNLTGALNISDTTAVRLRGHGAATTLLITAGPAVAITGSTSISITDLVISEHQAVEVIEAPAAVKAVAISATDVTDLRLERLIIRLTSADPTSAGITLARNASSLRVVDNDIQAQNGLVGLPDPVLGFITLTGAEIADNRFRCAQYGIQLQITESAGPLRIQCNDVEQCAATGISVNGDLVRGSTVEISENSLTMTGNGIACGMVTAYVHDNDLRCAAAPESKFAGISVKSDLKSTETAIRIVANRILGFSGPAIDVASTVTALAADILSNSIAQCGAGIAFNGNGSSQTQSVRISGNQVNDINPGTPRDGAELVCIQVLGASDAVVSNNTLMRCGRKLPASGYLFGIAVTQCDFVQVVANEIVGLGPENGNGMLTFGIFVLAPMSQVCIADNRVVRDYNDTPAADTATWIGILVANIIGATTTAVRNFLNKHALPPSLTALMKSVKGVADTPVRAAIRGNQISARGQGYGLAAFQMNHCSVSNNHSERIPPERPLPNVAIQTNTAIVDGNHVADSPVPAGQPAAVAITVPKAPQVTVLGNMATGQITVNGAALAAPWAPLNVHI